jgi:hypothetical protein
MRTPTIGSPTCSRSRIRVRVGGPVGSRRERASIAPPHVLYPLAQVRAVSRFR